MRLKNRCLRVSDKTWEAWKRAAEKDGRSIANWLEVVTTAMYDLDSGTPRGVPLASLTDHPVAKKEIGDAVFHHIQRYSDGNGGFTGCVPGMEEPYWAKADRIQDERDEESLNQFNKDWKPKTAEEAERVNNQFGDFSNDPESYKGQIEAHDRMSKAVTAHWKPPMPSAPKHEVRPIGKIAKKLKGGK